MTVSVEDFVARFPEFKEGVTYKPSLVENVLSESELRTPIDIWGTYQDLGIMYYAAYMLSRLPNGRDLKIVDNKDENFYLSEWKKLAKTVAGGPHLAS